MNPGRRSTMAAIAAAVTGLAGTGWLFLRAWLPWISQGADGRWNLGSRTRFPKGTATLLRRARAIVVHDDDGLHALTAICTHQGCTVHDTPARKEITCPCHGAAYTYRGDVKRGPAEAPLVWLALTVEDGELVLDPSKQVPRT